jgi:hypothetical protein
MESPFRALLLSSEWSVHCSEWVKVKVKINVIVLHAMKACGEVVV